MFQVRLDADGVGVEGGPGAALWRIQEIVARLWQRRLRFENHGFRASARRRSDRSEHQSRRENSPHRPPNATALSPGDSTRKANGRPLRRRSFESELKRLDRQALLSEEHPSSKVSDVGQHEAPISHRKPMEFALLGALGGAKFTLRRPPPREARRWDLSKAPKALPLPACPTPGRARRRRFLRQRERPTPPQQGSP
jgi:hypothetical protein